jgi:hypothetical protein
MDYPVYLIPTKGSRKTSCDQSAEDAYSSTVSDPTTFAFVWVGVVLYSTLYDFRRLW